MSKFKNIYDKLSSNEEVISLIKNMDNIDTYINKNIKVCKSNYILNRVNIITKHILYNNPVMVFIYNIGYYNNYNVYMKIIDYLEELSNVLFSINKMREELLMYYHDNILNIEEVIKLNYLTNQVFSSTKNYIYALIGAKKKELKYKGMHMSVAIDFDSDYTMDECEIFYKDFVNKKKEDIKR